MTAPKAVRSPINCGCLASRLAPSLAASLIAIGLLGQSATAKAPSAAFAAYPAKETFRGTPRAPRLGGIAIPHAYKPFVRKGALRGPNFAGAYTVVTIGCGTGCQAVLVISARTGRVYKAPEAATYGVTFRRKSRLLVFNVDPVHRQKAQYFVFDGGRFRKIRGPR